MICLTTTRGRRVQIWNPILFLRLFPCFEFFICAGISVKMKSNCLCFVFVARSHEKQLDLNTEYLTVFHITTNKKRNKEKRKKILTGSKHFSPSTQTVKTWLPLLSETIHLVKSRLDSLYICANERLLWGPWKKITDHKTAGEDSCFLAYFFFLLSGGVKKEKREEHHVSGDGWSSGAVGWC